MTFACSSFGSSNFPHVSRGASRAACCDCRDAAVEAAAGQVVRGCRGRRRGQQGGPTPGGHQRAKQHPLVVRWDRGRRDGEPRVRHCFCLVFPLPSRLRQCLSVRSHSGIGTTSSAWEATTNKGSPRGITTVRVFIVCAAVLPSVDVQCSVLSLPGRFCRSRAPSLPSVGWGCRRCLMMSKMFDDDVWSCATGWIAPERRGVDVCCNGI